MHQACEECLVNWITDSLPKVCVVLSLCTDLTPKQIEMPPEDAGVWNFVRPEPIPASLPVAPNIVLHAAPPAPAPQLVRASH